jgi:hypothetical protein
MSGRDMRRQDCREKVEPSERVDCDQLCFMTCGFADGYNRSGGKYCLHFQGEVMEMFPPKRRKLPVRPHGVSDRQPELLKNLVKWPALSSSVR